MMMLKKFLALIGGMVLLACAPVTTMPAEAQDATITLQRGVCFGFCPDYTVVVHGNGDVVFTGRRFVNVVGEARGHIEPSAVAALLQKFDDAHFMQLQDEYRANNITDLPTYIVTLERGGQRKVVVDYAGTRAGMPQAVRDLQQEIDRVAGTAQWVLRDGRPVTGRQEP